MGLSDIISRLSSSASQPPSDFFIKPENTDNPQRLATPFKSNEHYFMLQINEMFLSQDRQWFNKIMPLVYTSTEFKYKGIEDKITTPFVVGPSLLSTQIKDHARDMIFRDTSVAGWHPYRGEKIAFTVLLCKTTTDNLLLNTLGIIEKVSGIFSANVSALVSKVVDISKVVVDGLNGIFNSKDVEGLALLRREFDSTKSGGFYPGYYLLLNKTIDENEQQKFFVKDNRLYYGNDLNTSKPYREEDYVLISIEQSKTRNDYSSFPFYKMYDTALEMASKRPLDDEKKDEISNQLLAMTAAMSQSPDMVEEQAMAVGDESYEKIKRLVTKNYKLGGAPAAQGANSEFWNRMSQKIKAL